MIIRVLTVGGVKGPLGTVVEEYETRARRYWRLESEEVQGGVAKSRKADAASVMEAEAVRILPRISGDAWVVALTREGKRVGSRPLAETLEEKAVRSVQEVVFVIGGAYGLGEGVLRRADFRLSLSELTLPHEVARLILAEQLYRAGTIVRNEPYHKGP